MTVIAAYNHFGCGLVLGDILVNGPFVEGVNEHIKLPTVGKVSEFFGEAWAIYHPIQKVLVVNDHCVVAWAGSYLSARIFINRLVRLSRRVRLNRELIARIFCRHGGEDLQIVGAVNERGIVQSFGLDCEGIRCPVLGEVYAGGSGASIINDYIRIVEDMKLAAPPKDEVAARGVSLVVSQVAHLLNAEFRKNEAADSIREMFGGGL